MQVPHHDFRLVEDEGGGVVKIDVELPGVTSALEITVRIEPPHTVDVVVPDRYHLLLQLAVPIAAIADSVKFKRKTCKLTMCCRVQASTGQEPAAADVHPAADTGQRQEPQQHSQKQPEAGQYKQQQQHDQELARAADAEQAELQQRLHALPEALHTVAAAAAAPGVQHQTNQQAQQQGEASSNKEAENAAATAAGDPAQAWQLLQQKCKQEAEEAAAAEKQWQMQAKQQQQEKAAVAAAEQQRQMQAVKQQQQEEAAAAAAAAAAAEEQRQWQAEQRKLQQQQAAAEAAAKRLLREQRAREEREMANKAAAQEWLSQGQTAVSQRNIELASRALSKATELDPSNTRCLQQLSKQLDKLQQQKAAAASAAATNHAVSSGTNSSPTTISSPASVSSPSSAMSCQTPLAKVEEGGAAAGSTDGTEASNKPSRPVQQQQQQQQSTQSALSWDDRVDKTVAGFMGAGDDGPGKPFLRPDSRSPLGWCCALLHALLVGGMHACLRTSCFFLVLSKKEGGGWLWAKTTLLRQALCLLTVFCLFVMSVLFVAPIYLWIYAWMAPISIAGGFDSCMGVPGSTIREWKQELSEASADELRPGIFKLGLASVSAAVVYGLVWLTCLAQLGGHSLAGWLLVGLLVVWRAVIWVWDLVLWDPPAGYPLQMITGGLTTFICSVSDIAITGDCKLALAPLQVMLAGGRTVTLCSLVIAFLWRLVGTDWMQPPTTVTVGVPAAGADAANLTTAAVEPAAKPAPGRNLAPWWQAYLLGMSPMIVRTWLLALSSCSFMQQPMAAAADIIVSASVLCAHTLACVLSTASALKTWIVHAMAFIVGGPWRLIVSCWPVRSFLAAANLLPLRLLNVLTVPIKLVAALPYRLAGFALQTAAMALVGVLTWALPKSVVEPLVQESCAIMGQWHDSCHQLLGPHVSSMAAESLSLPHSWWFTVVLQLWLGFLLWRITYRYAHIDELMQQRQAQAERDRKEAARHKKEQKVQQRRQLRKQGR